jgi:RNA polymerase sigma factor (sigma-70 family)
VTRLDDQAEDRQVVTRVLAGDTEAFSVLERKYRRMVSYLIRKLIRSDEDVEDLTQDTFMKAYAALRYYRPEFPFSTWLYKIASNRCIDHLRRSRFSPSSMISIDQPLVSTDGSERVIDPRDHEPLPDAVVLAQERSEMLRAAMNALPEKYRVVIHLRHEEDLDYQEIADRLQLPLGTVKAHLFRARKALHKALLQHGSHFAGYMPAKERAEEDGMGKTYEA